MYRSRQLLSLSVLLALPLPLSGQAPAVRAGLAAFQDSLAKVTDSTALRGLEGRLIGEARTRRNDPALHLRLGFLALRIGELGERRHYDDAASEFQWATQLAPTWPYAWLGLGLSEFALGQANGAARGAGSGRGYLAQDALLRSTTALARSAVIEPAFADRLTDVANTARLQRMPAKAVVALSALREAANVTNRRQPDVLLALGRVEREFGHVPAALTAFEGFLTRGGNHPLGLLEVARTRFLLGRLDGQEPYYQGATANDNEAVEAYRADLAFVASPDELMRFDALHGSDRAAFLREFWRARDAADFREDGERLREHYRRIYYARRTYPMGLPSRGFAETERIAIDDPHLDDRGLVYVRQGAPDDRRTLAALGVEPNESWRYIRPGQDLVMHFVARQDPATFKMVESVFDIVDVRASMGAGRGGDGRRAGAVSAVAEDSRSGASPILALRRTDMLLRSREGLAPVYQPIGSETARQAAALQVGERALGHASRIRATTTDAFPRRFRRDVRARMQVLATESGGGNDAEPGRITVAWAVPGGEAEPLPYGKELRYPIRLRLALFHPDGRLAATLDTVQQVISSHWIGRDRYVQGFLTWQVPVGDYTWRALVQQGGEEEAGSLVEESDLTVASRTESFSAGDLVLGSRSDRLTLTLPSRDSLWLNPTQEFSRSEPVEVQLEVVSDNPLPRPVQLQATVIRKDDDGGVALNRSWEGRLTGGVTGLRSRLDLGRLSAGAYTLELTVRDARGGLVRRWAEFNLTTP